MQLISQEVIYQHFGKDDPETIREIIELIQSTHLIDLKELKNFFQNGEFSTIKKRCHKAKPSMSYLGASTVTKTLEEIENQVENSDSLIHELQNQLAILESELAEFLSKLP
jgi:HPt (histidine-containing phosphotransfer) domain-containing protein